MEAKYSYLSEIHGTGNQLQTQCHKLSSPNYFIYAQIYFPCIKGDLWSLFHALDIAQNSRRKIFLTAFLPSARGDMHLQLKMLTIWKNPVAINP